MHHITHSLLLILFWLLAGGLMQASGMAPLGTMLVLIGVTLPVLVTQRVFARHETGRKQAGPRIHGLGAWLRLQRHDWLWLVLATAVGLGITAFGMSCRCGAG